MAYQEFTKDPQAVLDYEFDWSVWLDTNETIATSTFAIDTGITRVSDSINDDNLGVTIWLSGGTVNTDYLIVNHITTDASREEDRTIKIKVRNR